MAQEDSRTSALPSHQIKLSVSISYNFPALQESGTAPPKSHNTKGLKKEDQLRSIFVSFSGPGCEGRSPPLQPDANSWKADFDLTVNLPLINEVLSRPMEFRVFENVKVSLAPAKHEKNLVLPGIPKFTLATTGLTEAQARLKRTRKLHPAQQSPEKPDGDEIGAASAPCSAPANSSDAPNAVKIGPLTPVRPQKNEEVATGTKFSKKHRTTFADSPPPGVPDKAVVGVDVRKTALSRPTSAYSDAQDSDAPTLKNCRRHDTPPPVRYSPEYHSNSGVKTGGTGRKGGKQSGTQSSRSEEHATSEAKKVTPHPHHFDHPERHGLLLSAGIKRSRSALSLSNVASVHLRPRTPPQPHHSDHPMTILFPRGRARSAKSDAVATPGLSQANRPAPRPDMGEFKLLPMNSILPSSGINPDGKDGKIAISTRTSKFIDGKAIHHSQALNALSLEVHPTNSSRYLDISDMSYHAAALLDPAHSVRRLAYNDDKARKDRKTKVVQEIQKVLVGSLFVDLSVLVVGELQLSKSISQKIDGLTALSVAVSTDQHLLSAQQQVLLNPLTISLGSAEGMPDQPVSFKDLDRYCYPTMAIFKFYDEPQFYDSTADIPHRSACSFNSKHIILTGLLNGDKLNEYFTKYHLAVEIHDRQLRIPHGADYAQEEAQPTPYGVASFDLSELSKGSTSLELASPILPSKRDDKRAAFPPGLWLQSGASLSIKIDIAHAFIPPAKESGVFKRLIIVTSNSDSFIPVLVENAVDEINARSLYVEVQDRRIRKKALLDIHVTEEQLSYPEMDVVNGFSFSDANVQIFMLEGVADRGIQQLLTTILRSGKNILLRTSQNYIHRVWNLNSVGLYHVRLEPSLTQIAHTAKTYLMGSLPFDCYSCVVQLYKCIDPRYEFLPFVQFPSLAMVRSLIHIFGAVVDFDGYNKPDSQGQTSASPTMETKKVTEWRITKRVDDRNKAFEGRISNRAIKDWIKDYKAKYPATACKRPRAYDISTYNYSIQEFSSTEEQLTLLRARLEKNRSYFYSTKFNLPLHLVPHGRASGI